MSCQQVLSPHWLPHPPSWGPFPLPPSRMLPSCVHRLAQGRLARQGLKEAYCALRRDAGLPQESPLLHPPSKGDLVRGSVGGARNPTMAGSTCCPAARGRAGRAQCLGTRPPAHSHSCAAARCWQQSRWPGLAWQRQALENRCCWEEKEREVKKA